MASSPLKSQPAPFRSPDKSDASLRHPVPDLQSLQGAYVGNIERLEEYAERMSESGSDLQEEIRKSYTDLKRSDSRRSSLRSIQPFEEPTRLFTTRSRNVSTSSHANSIVDLNGNARWGGYSPGGYITSPVGSLRSGSWSNPPTSVQRQRSESKTSRLGQVVHPHEVEEDAERLAANPDSPQSLPLAPRNTESPPPEAQRKVSSFTRIYDEVASGLPEELRNSVIMNQPPDQDAERGHEHRETTQYRYADRHDLPDRPPTAASTDTTHQARTLWQDFDGVHCPDPVIEEEPTPSYSSHSRHSSHSSFLMRSNPDLPAMGAPPPDDGMVFYPAPVPRMLNLPKRLSQLPTTSVQARRRTQLLESMQLENRKSAPLLGEVLDLPKPNNRKSRQSMMTLPPQLRASAYFDQVGPAQEFAVKGDSAKDTLDSILDASASAPVSAFTDHPFVGQVGQEVYGPEHKRKSSNFPEPPPMLSETKRRSSFNVLDTKRNSSGDPLKKLKKRNSSADMNLLIVKASESRMSLGDELDEHDEHARGPQFEDDTTPTRRSSPDEHGRDPDNVYEEEFLMEQGEEDVEEEQQYFGAPTTLLAELQMRKAKQKTRNMNYATLVEQGMMTSHRTLLEMDDMAENEKQRRLRKKVHLAWEADDDDSDDDVPLGVLYKQPAGQQSQERIRPPGLIAQRELEDSEPLSRRRNRLRGVSPNKRGTQYLGASSSQLNLAVPTTTTPGPDSDEEEGETLGERMRRLKDKQMLGAALGNDVRQSTVSGEFAAEMLSQIGGPGVEEKKQERPHPTPSPGIEEEETLGQRRVRLQAEAAARGEAPPTGARPGLRSSLSLANLLSANPIDTTNQARKISNETLVSHLPQGSLLQQNVVAEERRKAQRLTQNMRASSYGKMDPLLRNVANKKDNDETIAAKIQAYKNKMAGISTPNSMMFNGQMMGTPNMSSTNLSGQRESFMPSMMGMNGMAMLSQPNLNMTMAPMQQPMMPMNMGVMQQPIGGFQYPQAHPGMMRQSSMMSMPMMGGMGMGMNGMSMGMGMNGMPMGMSMDMGMGMQNQMMMPPMDPRQRDQIDQWVQGVRH